ncbi:hypothetical protein B0H19DRAFT_1070511 [Mycena capillaripes]|nr:hypothetical protein B0H19DRAFT_1070511 [Mycena capillaripes]
MTQEQFQLEAVVPSLKNVSRFQADSGRLPGCGRHVETQDRGCSVSKFRQSLINFPVRKMVTSRSRKLLALISLVRFNKFALPISPPGPAVRTTSRYVGIIGLILLLIAMLGRTETKKYLDQCSDFRLAIEEVLGAYIVWGADSERVLLKLGYLSKDLRLTGRCHILEAGAAAFKVLALEVALGGERIRLLPAMTVPGRIVGNELRRAAASSSLVTDSVYGGPGPSRHFYRVLRAGLCRTTKHGRLRLSDTRVNHGEISRHPIDGRTILTTLPSYANRDETSANHPFVVA